MDSIELMQKIRTVKDFPKPGILFRDISPWLEDPKYSRAVLDLSLAKIKHLKIDGIAGLESRGFIFGQALALELQLPFYMIRKAGKLPGATYRADYALEYGQASLEIHQQSIFKGAKILIHDDLLATGGTALAAQNLVLQTGAEVVAYLFLIELGDLGGAKTIEKQDKNAQIYSLIYY